MRINAHDNTSHQCGDIPPSQGQDNWIEQSLSQHSHNWSNDFYEIGPRSHFRSSLRGLLCVLRHSSIEWTMVQNRCCNFIGKEKNAIQRTIAHSMAKNCHFEFHWLLLLWWPPFLQQFSYPLSPPKRNVRPIACKRNMRSLGGLDVICADRMIVLNSHLLQDVWCCNRASKTWRDKSSTIAMFSSAKPMNEASAVVKRGRRGRPPRSSNKPTFLRKTNKWVKSNSSPRVAIGQIFTRGRTNGKSCDSRIFLCFITLTGVKYYVNY